MPGWMCCDRWEKWENWSDEDRSVAVKSTASQAAFLASHPSVMAFFLASDFAPPDDIADDYQAALRAHGFSGTILPSAEHYETHDLKSGMKMTGPYDWVPPHYWYFPHNGGAFGFLTESSPGAAIPELESLRGMLTAGELDTLWRNPAAPQLHAGGRGSDFETLDEFGEALFARHGRATSLEDFVLKAQLMNYESERIPFEAYRHNKYAKSTGFIHWLVNSSWPSLIWTLYGFDLAPSAGYYGAKMGNAPVLMQYAFDRLRTGISAPGAKTDVELAPTRSTSV